MTEPAARTAGAVAVPMVEHDRFDHAISGMALPGTATTRTAAMTITDIQRATIVAAPPSSQPRLHLAPVRAGRAVLDGGWWPRSWDPVAEPPGLILDLDASFGPIHQVLLNIDAWDRHLRRLAVGARVVRMGWLASLDPALLIATTERGDQVDLLVVPPGAAPATARAAMARAADPANTTHAPARTPRPTGALTTTRSH
jgi:hypothetical protein